jgi:hypothetical protein
MLDGVHAISRAGRASESESESESEREREREREREATGEASAQQGSSRQARWWQISLQPPRPPLCTRSAITSMMARLRMTGRAHAPQSAR